MSSKLVAVDIANLAYANSDQQHAARVRKQRQASAAARRRVSIRESAWWTAPARALRRTRTVTAAAVHAVARALDAPAIPVTERRESVVPETAAAQ